MNKTFLYFLTLFCFSIFINEQLSSQTNKVSFEKVSLIDVKSNPINSDFEIVDIDVDAKCFPFLGSYDDWTGEKKWRWLSFKKYLNEEFYDYLNQTVKVQDDSKKVSLYIHEFRLKQYLFFNPKGCYFRYEYELYYIEQNKKYSFFLRIK
jgi:hypothetical protein